MKKFKELTNKDTSDKSVAGDAIRRAEAFPVKGGDIVPIQRKSWFKTVEQKQGLPKVS